MLPSVWKEECIGWIEEESKSAPYKDELDKMDMILWFGSEKNNEIVLVNLMECMIK